MTSTDTVAARGNTVFSTLRHTGMVIGAATITAGILWAIERAVLGEDLTVAFNGSPQTVSLGSVLLTTLLAALAGWGSLQLARRVSERGVKGWTILAVLVTLLSFSGPLSAQASGGTKASLLLLHLAVALILIPGLPRAVGRSDA